MSRIWIAGDHFGFRANTMRMSMRRFTRLTNAFGKKFDNHCHSLALYFVHYNWMRKHKAHGKTPAIAAGITDKVMTMVDLAQIIDRREEYALTQKRRGMLSYAEAEKPQSN
jgi:hypothetical protein